MPVTPARPRLHRLWEATLDVFFPRHCVGYGREGGYICPACSETLPRLTADPGFSAAPDGPVTLDSMTSAFAFESVVRQAVHQLKYYHLRGLAAPLAALLHAEVGAGLPPATVMGAGAVTPIPLAGTRLQPGRTTGTRAGPGLWPDAPGHAMRRTRRNPSQARSGSIRERRENVRDAFTVTPGFNPGETVILVDDVATNGATLNAAGAALKLAGAPCVHGLTLAREI